MKTIFIASALCFLLGRASGAHYYVTTPGSSSGVSWENPTSLVNAIKLAKPGDSIFIYNGTYYLDSLEGSSCSARPMLVREGVSIFGSFSSTSFPANPIGRSNPLTGTIITCDLNSNDLWDKGEAPLIFSVTPSDSSTVLISGVVFKSSKRAVDISEGSINFDRCGFEDFVYSSEGIITTSTSEVSISGCAFQHNFIIGAGAIIEDRDSSVISIDGSLFFDNISQGFDAIVGCVLKGILSEVQITNSVFEENVCSGRGSLIYGNSEVNITFINCSFSGNSTSISTNSITLIRNCTIYNSVLYYDEMLEHLFSSTANNFELDHCIVPNQFTIDH